MLSPADLDLVARDPGVPGLAMALDPEAMAKALGLAPTPGAIFYVRYKPRTSCLVGMTLLQEGKPISLSIHARRRDAADKFGKARTRPEVMVLPDPAITVSAFPEDRRLPGLKRAERELGHFELLNYRPERRFVARIERDGRPVALKLYRKPDFARVKASARAFASRGPLRIPALVWQSQSLRALAFEWIDGHPVEPGANTAQPVGEALALLHAQSSRRLQTLPRAEQAGALMKLARDIAALWPSLGQRARQLARSLSSALLAHDHPLSAIHGDFHLGQLLSFADGIAMLDFDEAAFGSPAWDLGNIAGHMLAHHVPGALEFGQGVTEAYLSAGGRVSPAEVELQTAISLMRLATRPFRERAADWPQRIEALLDQVEALIGGKPVRRSRDPEMPLIDLALDPASVGARIGCEITAAELVRHKPGRRCLIAYDGATPLVGKMRARGVDARTFRVQRALWEREIPVPEPVAMIPELALWLQRKVEGESLFYRLDNSDPARAAHTIAGLHKDGVETDRQHFIADEIAILESRLTGLVDLRPELRPRVETLMANARQLSRSIVATRTRPIHRDFYPDHLLVDGARLWIVDLDLYCMGDPATDIGNFLAHIADFALRQFGDPRRWSAWQDEFVNAYRGQMPEVPFANIETYRLLSLARLVAIAGAMPERRAFVEPLLDHTEMLFEIAFDERNARHENGFRCRV